MASRDRWSSRTSFILAAIGSAVGLGNVWRFPYIAYKYGGGAFLIPYFVALIVAGIPLLILEYYLGQSTQQGAPGALKKIGKNWEILGWFAIFVGFMIVTYYAVIMGWAFAYLGKTLSIHKIANFDTFFHNNFLHKSKDILHIGGINLPIFIGLLLTWLSMIFIIFKGTKSVGKVVAITVPLPFLILLIFTIRGLFLHGSVNGLNLYLTPNFKALLKPETWLAAFGQIFFSLSIGFGVMIAYASFNPKKSDIVNNAFITGLINSLTSYIAGFAVFSALGFLALKHGVRVQSVVKSGPGLAFVIFPEIIKMLPFAKFFFLLFFLMLLTLGIDSAFSLVEAFITGISDKLKWTKVTIIVVFSIIGFLLGIIYTTDGGLYWLDVIDYFLSNYGLIIVGLLEAIALGLFYNIEKARNDINEVSEIKIGKWWTYSIKFIIPIILITLLGMNIKDLIIKGYNGYPKLLLGIVGPGILILGLIFGIIMKNIKRGE